MDQAVEEGPCCDDDSLAAIKDTNMILYTNNPAIFDNNAVYECLPEMKVFFLLHNGFHGEPVELFIALESGGLNGGSFRGIEQPEMDGRLISDLPHFSAQGIYFLDKLALGEAPDGGITRHEGNRI
jgi:hypothetical protein